MTKNNYPQHESSFSPHEHVSQLARLTVDPFKISSPFESVQTVILRPDAENIQVTCTEF